MLVLTRRSGESIEIPDCQITITVLAADRGRARIGIVAPDKTILRSELIDQANFGQELGGEG